MIGVFLRSYQSKFFLRRFSVPFFNVFHLPPWHPPPGIVMFCAWGVLAALGAWVQHRLFVRKEQEFPVVKVCVCGQIGEQVA